MDTLTELTQRGEEFFQQGVKMPRLTEIMQDLGIVDYSKIPKDTRNWAMDRGSKVHKTCELWDLGTLRVETLDERLVPYLDGWQRAVEVLRLTFTHIEVRMVNETYWYCCKPDRVGAADGEPAVIEIKTGEVPWWVGMQLSAQAACMPDGHTYRRIAIGLPGDGTYKPVYPDKLPDGRNDRAMILTGISLYNRKQNNK